MKAFKKGVLYHGIACNRGPKRDFRDNGERKIKKSKEGASSSTSKVDEDLVRSFCLFSVMAPLFTFSRIRGKLI